MIFLWLGIVTAGVLLDRLTKSLAVQYLMGHDPAGFIPHVLRFSYVENTGAAFGMLKGHRWVFLVISTVAIIAMLAVLIIYGRRLSAAACVAVSLLISGGLGNQIDRIMNGFVVDFLEFEFISFPVFNLADVFVTCGTALLLIMLIFGPDNKLLTGSDTGKKDGGDGDNL